MYVQPESRKQEGSICAPPLFLFYFLKYSQMGPFITFEASLEPASRTCDVPSSSLGTWRSAWTGSARAGCGGGVWLAWPKACFASIDNQLSFFDKYSFLFIII